MNGELIPVGGGDPIPLLKTELLVGRRESCDIVLRFANVSAHHCKMEVRDGYWYVVDQNSRNGTKVNGVQVDEKRLDPGDVLAVARVAGIQAAKQTQHLIPLCHQLPLSFAGVEFEVRDETVVSTCTVRTTAQTGVEMEALTGVSVALLTIYDMCKAIDKKMSIEEVKLLNKEKKEISND